DTPFYERSDAGKDKAVISAERIGMPLEIVDAGPEYLRIVRKPRHGHGSGMNPCIDCRIYMLKKAWKYAEQIGAKFIITGEVVGQRPMSQRTHAMKLIEDASGLKGKIVRPLSGKNLLKTEAEKEGWIARESLHGICGRSRKVQMQLAEELEIGNYQPPGGGCLLTCAEFARKVRDLLLHKKRVFAGDLEMLKVGRHFRFGGNKIIVGANEQDNKVLLKLKNKTDYIFEVPKIGSPVTILTGNKTKDAIKMAASLTARYSDAIGDMVIVRYGRKRAVRGICVGSAKQKEIENLRI
ncbi:MAG: hypothetical protein KAH93_01120, partial [Candidatus Aenigmarchaeota archaeon]|nr:hypothetical protein [Candidatus Aenigmarchaeota archaeon]